MSKPKAYSYVRWSTPKQTDKDSERRQIEAAETYASKNDLTLIPLRDPATSGYSGKHISKGELGEFLSKVKKGKIPKGSKLIFESVDRLTRLKINEAQKLFIELLEAGITLVPLDHGNNPEITLKEYQKNQGIVYQLTGEIQRAYRESKRKSDLLSAARKNERMQARNGNRKISGMPPMWLEHKKDEKGKVVGYIEKKKVVKVINLMFQMKANGKGVYRIERELNEMEGIYFPEGKRNKAGAWRQSTINRYLSDRRLIGEYQPHKYLNKEDGTRERVKAGDPIPDYYPEVVEPKTFHKVQAVLRQNSKRKGNTGGRTGKASNLFVHLVKCGHCGDSMRYQNKGKWQYLRCDDNARGLKCGESRTVRYDTIAEPLLLRYCRGLEASDIMPGDEQRQSELTSLHKELQTVEGELTQMEKSISNLVDKIESGEEIMERYEKRKEQKGELESRHSDLRARIKELNDANNNTAKRLRDIQALIEHLEEAEGEASVNLRLNIRAKLQRLIKRIDINFGTLQEYGQSYTTFTIEFLDGVKRILLLIEDQLDEVITIDEVGVDIQDIARERQREINRKIKINDPRRAQK